MKVFKDITFIFNSIDIKNIDKVIFKDNKVLISIKTYKDNKAINIIINKLY